MTFGKWSLILFSVALLGFFVVQYIIPILAIVPPTGTNEINVSLSTPSDAAYRKDTLRNVNFTYNVSWNTVTANITNCSLIGNFTNNVWTNYSTNTTTIVNNAFNGINYTFSSDGPYIWNIYCYNVSGNVGNYSLSNRTVIVDITSPILNTTTPRDRQFISGNDSQLFEVYVYDDYLNLTNVTLRYQEHSGGAWLGSVGNMNCYEQTKPLFICNTTVSDLFDNYGEGAQIDYYFEATDNATNFGNNGTSTSYNYLKIDRTAPANASAAEKITSGGYWSPGLNYGFQIDWTDTGGSGVSTVLFEHNFTTAGSLTNTTATYVSGNTYKVNFTQEQIVNASVGFAYRWYSNDSIIPLNKYNTLDSTNWAKTSLSAYTINKNQSTSDFMNLTLGNGTTVAEANNTVMYPQKINVTALNHSTVFNGQTIEFTLVRNGTVVGTGGSVIDENVKWAGGTVYNYTYNTSGNANYTAARKEFWMFVVQNSSNPVDAYLNDTANTNLTVVYPAQVNVTYLFTYNSSTDNTGTPQITKISGSTETDVTNNNAQSVRLANGTYEFKINITGNENYTSNATGLTHKVIVQKGTTSINLYINGTEANLTVAKGSGVNTTVYADNSEGTLFLYIGDVLYNQTTGVSTIHQYNMTTFSGNPGTQYNITGYYNGSQNYSASSVKEYWVKIENYPPTYTGLNIVIESGQGHNTTNNSYIGKNSGTFNITAIWKDGFVLDEYWLSNSTDDGGTFTNTPAISMPSGNGTNITIFPSAYAAGTVLQFRMYVNDTSGNENSTTTYRFTIDGTVPSLTGPRPANNSYITRNSSYPFHITVTDNTLNTTNVTLYYKKDIAGSWSSSKMSCTGDPPTYTCSNTTIDYMNNYVEGTVFYYYYEAYDNSSLVGRNGSSTNPLVITTDISAPQYSNNNTNVTVTGKYDTVLIYAYWTDSDTLNTVVLETNETGTAANKTTSQHALVTTFTGSAAWSNFTWSNSSVAVGTVVAWKIYANDSVGNMNVTGEGRFSIDNTVPTPIDWSSNVTNASTIAKGTVINISANWTDDIALGYWWVWYNDTGDADADGTNYTSYTQFSATNHSNSSYEWDTSSLTNGALINIRFYANDTSGNENVTDGSVWYWTIDGTKPTWSSNVTNVTNASTIVKGTVINLTAVWTDNVQLDKYLCSNDSSGAGVNGTPINFPASNQSDCIIDTSAFTAGITFNASIYANDTSGNENVTGIFTWTIDGTKPTYANQSDSVSGEATYAPGIAYYLNISWTDNLGDSTVSKVIFEWNGSAPNYTSATSPDVKSLSSSNYSIALTDLGVGNYTYKWYANDTSGNWNVTTVYTLNVTQNTTNPIDIYIKNSTQAYKNTNVTEGAGVSITVNATAVYGNETELKLYRNETPVGNPYTFTPTSAAVYVFKANITATNYTTNETSTFYLTVTEDTTGPTVLLYDYTNATVKKSGAQLTLNISVTDGSGVNQGDTCNVTISGVINRTITHSNGWCNGTITVPAIPSDGNYTINITVKDNSTNHNEGYNSSFVLTVDNTTPVVTITFPASGTYNKSDSAGYIWINGTAYDLIQMGTGNVTINSTYFNASASDFGPNSFNGTNNTAFAFRNTSSIPDGYRAVKINYTDNATNNGEATVYFYVDNTRPTSFTALTTGTKTKSSTQSVQVNVTDNLMTNASITLNYKRGGLDTSWQTATMIGTPAASTIYTGTIDTSMLGDGEIVYYYVTGIDNATNQFSTNNGSAANPLGNFKIGVTTAPLQPTGLAAVQVGSTRQVNITWTASASSDATGYYVYRDTGVVTTASTNLGEAGNTTKFTDTVPADGTWNYTVVAHDAVPNVNTTITANATVTIDITPPSVTAADTSPGKDSNGKISDNTPTLSVNTSEAGVCKYDTTDKSFTSLNNEMSGTSTIHTVTLSTLSDGTYTYFIRCNDTIGNVMTISSTISFILDTTGNFNYTQTLTGWDDLWIPSQSVMEAMGYTRTTTNAWNISYVLSTVAGLGTNYNLVYYYNGSSWASFNRANWAASSLQYMNNTNDKPYWINITTSDRFEI
jgi:hypothetical protein